MSFITQASSPADIFTPEDFTEEHRMIGDLAEQFVTNEVLPQQESLERQEWTTTTNLLRRCAELGLIGIEVPEQYGGENLDKVSAMIVTEKLARVASFGVSYGGQAGIGALPLVYFGTEHLKNKYLPSVCKAQKFAAYALSEAGSGSDALAAKATATRDANGKHWILNGEKMWITNAAFADIFVTFAQVDGNQFSCFIVEKDFPGVSTGAEEHKMGLKGSSTRPLILDNARVPLENLVGEVGKGHHVAFNILNIGRAKLGAISAGAGKTAFNDALRYARQRIAFGKPISSFGAIQHKLAEMAIRNWVVEGMVYRTAAMIDRKLAAAAPGDRLQELAAIREYAVECSILKVFGSEALDFVVDEAVQIYGGYGYSAEYPVERYYRDARVNRIFEGTNEINRLLISGMLLKQKVYLSNVDASSPLAGAKKAFQLLAALADETYKDTVKEQQEILMLLSDMAMAIYAMDTALCRSEKQASAEIPRLMTDVFVDDAMEHMRSCAKQITAAIHEVPNLDRLLEWVRINTIKARRRIAEYLTEN